MKYHTTSLSAYLHDKKYRQTRQTYVYMIALFLAAFSGSARSASEILLLLSKDNAPYRAFSQSFSNTMNAKHNYITKIKTLDISDVDKYIISKNSSNKETKKIKYVVTVGSKAARIASYYFKYTPILNTLIPKRTQTFTKKNSAIGEDSDVSTLYINQPYPRQLYAIKYATPTIERLGIILGPSSKSERAEITYSAKKIGIDVLFREVNDVDAIYNSLRYLLENTDGILAVPDRLIYNMSTAQNILLTTYQHGKPLFGYSNAYTQAGAVLSIYTTPTQFGRQAAEIVLERLKQPASLMSKNIFFPKYFKISVNYRVARTLNIHLQNVADIKSDLINREEYHYE